MIVKAVAAALSAFALVSASPPFADYPGERTVNYPMVKQVHCAGVRGTAFRLGGNRLVTVAHVVRNYDCRIDGQPITVTSKSDELDFAEITAPIPRLNGFPVNCDGIIPGQWFYAIGHARGAPTQAMVTVYATYAKHKSGMRALIGPATFIRGMSGGVVLNSRGEAVGTVNALIVGTQISLSRELRDTALCQS